IRETQDRGSTVRSNGNAAEGQNLASVRTFPLEVRLLLIGIQAVIHDQMQRPLIAKFDQQLSEVSPQPAALAAPCPRDSSKQGLKHLSTRSQMPEGVIQRKGRIHHLLVIPTDELYCPGRDSLPDQLPPLLIFTNNFLPDTRCGMKIDGSGRLKQLSERVSHQ